MDVRRLATEGALVAGAVMLLGACSDGTGVGAGDRVSLNFRVSGASVPAASPTRATPGPARVAGPPLVLEGTNGTLTLSEIRLVVNEVKLKRSDPSCDSSGSEDCDEFEVGPRFLDLPLDGQPVEAVTGLVPPGIYDELEFEIEDLEDDEEDATEAAAIVAVRAQILAVFPDWPRKASALAVGSFQPTDGEPVDFRVFMEAEVEIELDLIPNLVVDESGTTSRDLTVDVSPGAWFTNPDGTVLELQQYDFDATGKLLEFEVEMEHGFTKIEIED